MGIITKQTDGDDEVIAHPNEPDEFAIPINLYARRTDNNKASSKRSVLQST